MVLDSLKVIKALMNKGFEQKNTDHKVFEYFVDGKYILYTKVSHGSSHDIDNHLIGKMKRQCELSKKDFLDLINCPLSKKDYEKKIKQLGLHF